jgi:hypothetical protein
MRVLGFGKPLDYDEAGAVGAHHAIIAIGNGAIRTACNGSWLINDRWEMFTLEVFTLVPFAPALAKLLSEHGSRGLRRVCRECNRATARPSSRASHQLGAD